MEKEIVALLSENNLKLTAAESCTGGLFAAKITAVAGSSACFDGSFVTYSNGQKERLLGVKSEILRDFGAVSYQTALSMARGARASFCADIAISITGIAGPSGGSEEKPVGTVFIAAATNGGAVAHRCQFKGSRSEVRAAAVDFAQKLVLDTAKKLLTQTEI